MGNFLERRGNTLLNCQDSNSPSDGPGGLRGLRGPARVEWLQKPITGRNTLMCARWGDSNFYKSLAFRTFIELFLYVNWLHNFCYGKCRVAGMATQTQTNPFCVPALFYTGLLSVDFQIPKRTFPCPPECPRVHKL